MEGETTLVGALTPQSVSDQGQLTETGRKQSPEKHAHITGRKEGITPGKSGQRWASNMQKATPPTLCYTLQQLESSQLQRIHTWLKVAVTVHMWFIP